MRVKKILSGSVSLPFAAEEALAVEKGVKAFKKAAPELCGVPFDAYVYRRSTDARRKDEIFFVYTVAIEARGEAYFDADPDKLSRAGFRICPNDSVDVVLGSEPLSHRPVVAARDLRGCFALCFWRKTATRRCL